MPERSTPDFEAVQLPEIPDDDPYLARGQEHYVQRLLREHPEILPEDVASMAQIHLTYGWFRHLVCQLERFDEHRAQSGVTAPPWHER